MRFVIILTLTCLVGCGDGEALKSLQKKVGEQAKQIKELREDVKRFESENMIGIGNPFLAGMKKSILACDDNRLSLASQVAALQGDVADLNKRMGVRPAGTVNQSNQTEINLMNDKGQATVKISGGKLGKGAFIQLMAMEDGESPYVTLASKDRKSIVHLRARDGETAIYARVGKDCSEFAVDKDGPMVITTWPGQGANEDRRVFMGSMERVPMLWKEDGTGRAFQVRFNDRAE